MPVKLTGFDQFEGRLKRMKEDAKKEIKVMLFEVANAIHGDMVQSLRAAKHGKTYSRGYKRISRRPGDIKAFKGGMAHTFHRASAPGEAPATDTGALLRSVVLKSEKGGLTMFIGVSFGSGGAKVTGESAPIEYAKFLEYGTSKIAARPFVKPALDKNMPLVGRLAGRAVYRIARGK